MDSTSLLTRALLVSLLCLGSGMCHVVSYQAHHHLSGAPLGIHSPPYHFHLARPAAVLASSSSALRQVYSEPYYPPAGYPAYPPYGEYYAPGYPGYPQVSHLLPVNNQQVPPNATVSKLPPILESFVQRIQNLLSTYNPENHNQVNRPPTSFLQNHIKPIAANFGWPPQYITPAFTTFHPLTPSLGVIPEQSFPPPTQVRPERPTATHRPLETTTSSQIAMPSDNNPSTANLPANSGTRPNRPVSPPAALTPVSSNSNGQTMPPGYTPSSTNNPGSVSNVPQTALPNIPSPQPQPIDNSPPPAVSAGGGFPAISAYGAPDRLPNKVGSQRPPAWTPDSLDQVGQPQGTTNTNPNRGSSDRSLPTSEIIALIRQYGVPLGQTQDADRFQIVPAVSLTAPTRQGGERYNYQAPAKPLRYPARFH